MSTTPRLRHARTPAALLCACAILAACQDTVAPTATPPAVDASDPLVQRIAQMGYSVAGIVDDGEYFVVEGDILFRKADLAGAPRLNVSPLAGGPLHQYHTTNLVPQSMMAAGIPVSLAGILSNTQWTTAARAAIASWNATGGTKIKFVEVATGAYINFSFRTSSSTASIAQGGAPVNGYPGGAIIINPYYNTLSASQKQNVMAHELGHTIGHRHTNWNQVDCDTYAGDPATCNNNGGTDGAVHVPGTPSTTAETTSVMYGANHNWTGFTINDGIANRAMYPGPAPVVASQGYSGPDFTISWSPVSDAAQYRISYEYWFLDEVYDPAGNYYAWTQNYYDVTTTTGTTFTGPPQGTGANPYPCAYYVTPIYPSGKEGYSLRSQDVTC